MLINDLPASVEISSTGIYKTTFGPNVMNTVSYTRGAENLGQLAVALPAEGLSTSGVTRARFAGEVRRYGEEPWILLEGHWWRLNPARPDFHPRPGSPLLAGKGDSSDRPAHDLEGISRARSDIGAFVAR